MKQVNILSVCGSGTVTSSMVAGKLKEKLKENNIIATTTEARPTEALNLAKSGRFDLIVHTSPLAPRIASRINIASHAEGREPMKESPPLCDSPFV